MTFVETISGKPINLIKNRTGILLVNTVFCCPFKKSTFLRLHFLFNFFTHGAAKQIRLSQRKAGHNLSNLHDLLLINRHTIGFLEHRLQHVMHIIGFFLPFLTGDIARNIIHRPWTIQSNERDNIFKAVRLHFPKHIAHTGTFKLEHTYRIAVTQHGEGFLIIKC